MITLLPFKSNLLRISIKTYAPLIIIAIFLYSYIFSFLTYSNSELAFQFLTFSFILLLIYPLLEYKFDFNKIVKISGIILTFFSLLIFLLFTLNINNPLFVMIFDFLIDYGLIAIGYRGFFGSQQLFIHFGSIPFLFIPANLFFIDFLENKKARNLTIYLIMVSMILLSSSRALFLGIVLSTFLIIVNHQKNKLKFPLIISTSILFSFIVLYLFYNSTFFDLTDVSNMVKIGDASSFFSSINTFSFFFGNGLASYYFAAGRGFLIAHTENTLLDSLRYFGFPLTAVIFILLIFPSKKISFSVFNNYNLIFSIYLLMSLTNPILFNSVGAIVILWYWYKKFNNSSLYHFNNTVKA